MHPRLRKPVSRAGRPAPTRRPPRPGPRRWLLHPAQPPGGLSRAWGCVGQQLSVWGSGTVHRGQGPVSVPGPALDNRPCEGCGDKMQPERIWTRDCILLLTSERMSLVQPQAAQCLKQED